MRLDIYLFQNGFATSRNKAGELIKQRLVRVDRNVITKPSFEVSENSNIEVEDQKQYVSRAGDKLKGFLQEQQPYEIKDTNCLDIGSSTGGFVEVLLEYGAKSVTCVDVGDNQLHVNLRGNKKIKLYENTDIRKFDSKEQFDIVTCDVSFIGIEQIFEEIDKFAKDIIIILFKPQFEVGLGIKRTKKGVVKDNLAINRVMEKFEAQTFAKKWKLILKKQSVLKGKEGNEETFYCFSKR